MKQPSKPPSTFVNPYTFVPFPADGDPTRRTRPPAGHRALGTDRLMGRIDVRLTTHSPLLIRGIHADEQGSPSRDRPRETDQQRNRGRRRDTFPRRRFPGHDGEVPYVPGSSLAGVVRSLHETMTDGCLRVFNGRFLPSYRDDPQPRSDDWFLARVRQVHQGRPLQLELCRTHVWVDAEALATCFERDATAKGLDGVRGASLVRTGAEVVVGDGEDQRRTRTYGSQPGRAARRVEVDDPDALTVGRGWTILVTDAGTRVPTKTHPRTGEETPGRYFCAVGQLTPARDVRLVDGSWERYQEAVDETGDMRQARTDRESRNDAPAMVGVYHPGTDKLLGYRMPARRRVFVNQVLWVRCDRRNALGSDRDRPLAVTDIALTAIWRHVGAPHSTHGRAPDAPRGVAADRVPERLREPCHDPDALCPTCRVFGSASTSSAHSETSNRSYRGHLRFSDARPEQPYPTRTRHLPPWGYPRPGAGQFYLHNDPAHHGRTAASFQPALREWGSELDTGPSGPRQLRGRKHYWLTARPDDRPYFRAVSRHGAGAVFHELFTGDGVDDLGGMLTTAESMRKDAVFSFTVTFDNLDRAELGGLLCALDPSLLLRHPAVTDTDSDTGDGGAAHEQVRFGYGVGGGRALGFGSCTAATKLTECHTAGSRYAAEQPPTVGVDDAVTAFVDHHRGDMADTWRTLARVLRLDWVEPAQVWYPPAGDLASGAPEALTVSFAFWKSSRGYRPEHGADQLVVLPDADTDTKPGATLHTRTRDQSIPVVVDKKQLELGRNSVYDARKRHARRLAQIARRGPKQAPGQARDRGQDQEGKKR